MQYMVYFYIDKQIVIVPEEDVFSDKYGDYSAEDWLKQENRECRVMVMYNDQQYEACVLQVILDDKATNNVMLNKLRGIVLRKRLRPDRLLPLVARVMPERRQTIIPDNLIRTDPETSSEYETSSSAGPSVEIPLHPLVERVGSLKDLEFPQPTTSLLTDRNEEFLPKRRKVKVIPSQEHVPTLPPLVDAQPFITSIPEKSASFTDRGILNVVQELRATATANGFEASSNEGILFFMAAIIRQQGKLTSEISLLNANINSLKASVRQGEIIGDHQPTLSTPVFKSLDEVVDVAGYPSHLAEWMMREGGSSERDYIKRIMTKLMPNSVQLLLNRTGQKGKTAFPQPLENMIKECAVSLFPNTNRKAVESLISTTLKNARDREGGMTARRQRLQLSTRRRRLIDSDSD